MTTLQAAYHKLFFAGFTLLEVLISLGILAAGLLAMTALQNEALKFNYAAYLESQALFLLNDMSERMQANSLIDAYAINFTDATPAGTNCRVVVCTPEQMAVWDKSEWRALVEDQAYLPGAESEIRVDPSTRMYTIAIRYDSHNDASGKHTVSISSRIP